ncbi:sensor histidine kinase [Flagellimonas sp.]|uniref:sensor histidine kinase n=1 Tax=Flagellimonas sp. TaxID=2058762 RepID=UPI003B5A2D47
MSRLDALVDNKIVQNLFIWFCLFLIFTATIQSDNRLLSGVVGILLFAPSIYIQNLMILPLFNKKMGLFVLFSVLNATAFTFVSTFLLGKLLGEESYEWGMFLNFLGAQVLALIFGMAIKMARDNYSKRHRDKEAELQLLKGQLNPHFLFNTLNNLYGLSVVKSDKLPNLMLKLSDLLRYSLYDTKESVVSLEKEIQYIENYVALERIRLSDTTDIDFRVSGEVGSKSIAPMLLIIFLENAFKHLGSPKNERSSVEVDLKVADNTLYFLCSNTIDPVKPIEREQKNGIKNHTGGIGLRNAKKRLSLIYPERHKLAITEKNNCHKVQLTLNL